MGTRWEQDGDKTGTRQGQDGDKMGARQGQDIHGFQGFQIFQGGRGQDESKLNKCSGLIKIFGEEKIKMSNELYRGLGHVMWRVYWAQTPGSGGQCHHQSERSGSMELYMGP